MTAKGLPGKTSDESYTVESIKRELPG